MAVCAALPIAQCRADIGRATIAVVNHVGGDSVSGKAPQQDDYSLVTEPSLQQQGECASAGQDLIRGRHSCVSLQSPGAKEAGLRRRRSHGRAPQTGRPWPATKVTGPSGLSRAGGLSSRCSRAPRSVLARWPFSVRGSPL